MSSFVAESGVEEVCLEYFADLGWQVLYGPDIAPDAPRTERSSFRDVLLEGRLRDALSWLNPDLTAEQTDQVVATVRRPESADVLAENWRIHRLLTHGVPLERRGEQGEVRSDLAWLIDFEHPDRNDFVVVNQMSVEQERKTRRPDVLAFINGLPLGVIELKVPGEQRATLRGAWNQLGTYTKEVSALMAFSAVSVISTGTQARLGALGGKFEHYAPWKTIDGRTLAPRDVPELEVLVRGVFSPAVFLDLVGNFVAFSDERAGLVKRVAKYHQFHAVNKAVSATVGAVERGDGRAGVVWHTQGSGKSLEMLFYVNKLMRHRAMANPTAVLLTDRNDLDDQLFDEVFAPARSLPETPVQADSREHLRQLLGSKASGGIVFSTMQKFGLSKEDRDANRSFPLLSERSNIVVVADEAHRTQYDLIDGLARNLRDALPNAAFIGFTGTPIEASDRDTRAVFGEYIDVYDLSQSVEDGATVKVYYEARLAKVELPAEIRGEIDQSFAEVTELAEVEQRERLKTRWARVEAVVGATKRINEVAADIVEHWEKRRSVLAGKALVVCMSRRICVELYNAIVRLRPDWHSDEDDKGKIKVVITGSAADGPEFAPHVRNKQARRELKERAKNPDDPLELVIVRDMWLTGFDSPPMHTMYVDKPMQGAGLMQAIARVNRTFLDKPSGLVVDYIGIAESLQAALADYTERDRDSGEVGAPVDEALGLLAEKHEVLCELLYGCPWREALASGTDRARLEAIMAILDHILGASELDLPDRFLHHARVAGQAFTLAVSSPEALRFRDDLAFFQAVAVELRKMRSNGSNGVRDGVELETAVRQVVSDAVTATGVIDIYAAAGIERPDISLIDDSFVRRLSTNPHPNVQIELLKRLLNDELKTVARRNLIAERKFSEMLERAMRSYTNRSLDAAEIILQLVELAKELREERDRGAKLGLLDDELAFYDAVCQNDSAVIELGDDTLKAIAHELVAVVRRNATIDWDKKEQVRASLRRHIRRLLTKYKYPPDRQESAVLLVMQQAELFAAETTAACAPDSGRGGAVVGRAMDQTDKMMPVTDVETLIRQVWSPDVRPLTEEAWRCYNAGATRACIAATWTAVTADIITKLVRMADDGDKQAVPFRSSLTDAQAKGLSKDGVRAMQEIETALLDKAAEFELIDSIGMRELERIREDRNLCVHPSLRAFGDVYEPRPEVARGHLAIALTTLLTHPPTQGRKVIDEFSAYICDPFFVATIPHIQATFFDRVRAATRSTIVTFAAKHAMLELDPAGRMAAVEHADRMAAALVAFAQRDRELVRTAVARQSERFQRLDGAAQLRALIRLGDEDFFWSSVDQALATRLEGLLNVPLPQWEPPPPEITAAIALVRSPYARERLPALERQFPTLPWMNRLIVAGSRPDPYFVPTVIRRIQEAHSWRAGEEAGRVLIHHAPFLSIETLRTVLDAWCSNGQCRQAAGMPTLAVNLFQATTHLGPPRAPVFGQFLTNVRAIEGTNDYYSYPALEQALNHDETRL